VGRVGAASMHCELARCVDPAGVVEQGTGTRGSPGTWEARSSPPLERVGVTRAKSRIPRPPVRHAAPAGAKRACNGGSAKRRKTKRGVMGGRASQCPDSTAEAGESRPGDPVEGSGASNHGTV
jgi:hypothetical protein